MEIIKWEEGHGFQYAYRLLENRDAFRVVVDDNLSRGLGEDVEMIDNLAMVIRRHNTGVRLYLASLKFSFRKASQARRAALSVWSLDHLRVLAEEIDYEVTKNPWTPLGYLDRGEFTFTPPGPDGPAILAVRRPRPGQLDGEADAPL